MLPTVQSLTQASRPTRACGLKPDCVVSLVWSISVTPHTGVWIETKEDRRLVREQNVTPHTGVWIETLAIRLKEHYKGVTPHTGVWIETYQDNYLAHRYKSRPTRACGLKRFMHIIIPT